MRKLTLSEMNARMKDSGSTFLPMKEMVNTLDWVDFTCRKCKSTVNVLVQGALRGSPCPVCSGRNPSNEGYLLMLKKKFGEKITPLETFKGKTVKILRRCNVCGDERKTKPLKGCVYCNKEVQNEKRRTTHKQYLKMLKEKFPKIKIFLLETYINQRTPIQHSCSEGHSWTAAPSRVLGSKCGCPFCGSIARRENCEKTQIEKSYLFKPYKLGNRIVSVQGHEPYALDLLLKKLNPKDIVVRSPDPKSKKVPTIRWKYNGKNFLYFPDIYVPKKNLLIEVKGTYSMGLLGEKSYQYSSEEMLSRIQAKAKAVLDSGYKFELHLFDKGAEGKEHVKVKLPSGWINMTLKEIQLWYQSTKRD